MEFKSRRPVVVCHQGCVASSQPYASQIGLDVLKSGGNAADAAVAVAAALAVTEPYSTGLGGDAFCLFYDARTKTVKGLNGSGRASSRVSLSRVTEDGFSEACPLPERHHGHTVTVPGTAAAWEDTVLNFGSGKMSMQRIMRPAIELAETGFPVQYNVATVWREIGEALFRDRTHGQDMLLGGRAPRYGEIMTMPLLANVLKELASQGKDAIYRGRVARAICQAVQSHGGVMTEEDLTHHSSTLDQPLCTDYRGRCRVWEMPPNGQGLAVLLALNILEGFDLEGLQPNSSQYLHLVTEALRLSLADTRWYSTDPSQVTIPVDRLLSKEYAATRKALIDPARAMPQAERGDGAGGGDTVYFCVVDKEGNACSFINSIYAKFGSGIVPEGCGFPLQNRGLGFSLDPGHPNVLAAGKRSFHTIIPSMITCPRTGELLSAFGVMGGHMQPQGHVQVLLNQVEFGMDPQQALDQPRVRIDGRQRFPTNPENLTVEEGISPEVTKQLREMGHVVSEAVSGFERISFGLGQVISRGAWWDRSGAVCKESSVYWAGCDPRSDGVVAGY